MGFLRTMVVSARSIAAALICLGTLAYVSSRAQTQEQPPILVLVSAATGGGDISLGALRSAYESQPTPHRGLRLIPFNLAIGDSIRVRFDRVVLGLAAEQVGAFWIDQRIRSGLAAPRTVPTRDMMLRVIASLKGVIGYMAMSPNSVPSGILALTIDGKAPSDPGYPLR